MSTYRVGDRLKHKQSGAVFEIMSVSPGGGVINLTSITNASASFAASGLYLQQEFDTLPKPDQDASWMDEYPVGSKGWENTIQQEYEVFEHNRDNITLIFRKHLPLWHSRTAAKRCLQPYSDPANTFDDTATQIQCTCETFVWMNQGCRCGAFQKEQQMKAGGV